MIRGDCNTCVHKEKASDSATCVECGIASKNYKPITNADRIRAMSEDELAWFYAEKIASCYGCESSTMEDCYKCWLDWLKSEKK